MFKYDKLFCQWLFFILFYVFLQEDESSINYHYETIRLITLGNARIHEWLLPCDKTFHNGA